MIIRKMDPQEMDLVINLFQYYCDAAGVTEQEYDEQRLVRVIKNYTVSWNLFFQVAYEGTRPVGVIGGFVSEDPITALRVAAIQFNYLKPGHDSLVNYQQLIQQFESWALNEKASEIKCMDIGNNPSRLDDIYSQLGYTTAVIKIYGKEAT